MTTMMSNHLINSLVPKMENDSYKKLPVFVSGTPFDTPRHTTHDEYDDSILS